MISGPTIRFAPPIGSTWVHLLELFPLFIRLLSVGCLYFLSFFAGLSVAGGIFFLLAVGWSSWIIRNESMGQVLYYIGVPVFISALWYVKLASYPLAILAGGVLSGFFALHWILHYANLCCSGPMLVKDGNQLFDRVRWIVATMVGVWIVATALLALLSPAYLLVFAVFPVVLIFWLRSPIHTFNGFVEALAFWLEREVDPSDGPLSAPGRLPHRGFRILLMLLAVIGSAWCMCLLPWYLNEVSIHDGLLVAAVSPMEAFRNYPIAPPPTNWAAWGLHLCTPVLLPMACCIFVGSPVLALCRRTRVQYRGTVRGRGTPRPRGRNR